MKKILILGICGSGKTTLAEKLSKKLNIEIVNLDKHFWKPGWQQPPEEDWLQTVQELTNKKSWIMEGSYCESLHIRFPAADTIIFLELDRGRALFRVIKRTLLNYGKTRPYLAKGCFERFDWAYLNFLKHVWNFPSKQGALIETYLDKFKSQKKIYRGDPFDL